STASQGRVYVVDAGDNRVMICDGSMRWLAHFGGPGDSNGGGPGLFFAPAAIAGAQPGRLDAAAPDHPAVREGRGAQRSARAPPPIRISDNSGETTTGHTNLPAINYPYGIAVDANGRVLIADMGANAMWVLSNFADGLRLQPQIQIGTPSDGNFDEIVPPGPP